MTLPCAIRDKTLDAAVHVGVHTANREMQLRAEEVVRSRLLLPQHFRHCSVMVS